MCRYVCVNVVFVYRSRIINGYEVTDDFWAEFVEFKRVKYPPGSRVAFRWYRPIRLSAINDV